MEPQAEFATGEMVRLRIQINAREKIKDARLVVALCSPVHGVLSSVSTPYQGIHFDVDLPGRVITLEIPKIPFLIAPITSIFHCLDRKKSISIIVARCGEFFG